MKSVNSRIKIITNTIDNIIVRTMLNSSVINYTNITNFSLINNEKTSLGRTKVIKSIVFNYPILANAKMFFYN